MHTHPHTHLTCITRVIRPTQHTKLVRRIAYNDLTAETLTQMNASMCVSECKRESESERARARKNVRGSLRENVVCVVINLFIRQTVAHSVCLINKK